MRDTCLDVHGHHFNMLDTDPGLANDVMGEVQTNLS